MMQPDTTSLCSGARMAVISWGLVSPPPAVPAPAGRPSPRCCTRVQEGLLTSPRPKGTRGAEHALAFDGHDLALGQLLQVLHPLQETVFKRLDIQARTCPGESGVGDPLRQIRHLFPPLPAPDITLQTDITMKTAVDVDSYVESLGFPSTQIVRSEEKR